MAEKKIREYEVILVFDSSTTDDMAASQKEIEDGLVKREAEITHKEDWGKRKLFHPPKHIADGVFQYIKIKAPVTAIVQICSDLKLNTTVMKSMVSALN